MTSQPLPPVSPRIPRLIKIILAVSVALNLAVMGLIGGMLLHGGPGSRGDAAARDLGFGPFDDALSPQDRETVRNSLKDHMGDLRATRQMMRDNNAAILAALRNSPFDPAALTNSLTAQRQQLTDRLAIGSRIIQDFLLSMSDEARLAFADRLEDQMRHGRGVGKPSGD